MGGVKIPKKTISSCVQTGYHCNNCEMDNVVKGPVLIVPLCENCGHASLKQVFKVKVTTVTTTESV